MPTEVTDTSQFQFVELAGQLHESGMIAVLIIDDANDAVPVAKALQDGGVTAIELTLRTEAALESLSRIRSHCPEMIAGVGTVLSPEQVEQVKAAGASFGVAPGTNPRVVSAAIEQGLPFAPGICTPTDIEAAIECGCRLLKFFPAEPCGGLNYLRSIQAPYAHLGLQFIPLGGVSRHNMKNYLSESMVPCVGGSWVATREMIRDQNWKGITLNATEAMQIVKASREQGGSP
ncbi:bifunctional 4-hydroxy-2-oxoglutarate aldolase/2-dehydro-3-deoxy-phosphogluconate aldolase [Calycomorphotria hydatis]|uniref:2-dehydro-3-deoxy-phosphogluconate aldolase n=1 Tax=Calycomorphotria hydatis TaxID=2528027 RepID=A0A517T6B0_9PLAN|nr:bifunctional 4-hydroxy-2-oxoglutarate aldolase/2-dehydro-3-deoxy-phosphogluconate aldolase [Calycomorphotria hydatis]QDT63888.1 Putative KHG/KDPG aldolase [Calycomorphotria hydatis]